MNSIIINFSEAPHGLLPAIIQDSETQKVLDFAYMNEESFERTKEEGKLFLSQASTQHIYPFKFSQTEAIQVIDIKNNAQSNALLIKVKLEKQVNQTIASTNFEEENSADEHFLHTLENLIYHRKKNPIATSYTNKLFDKGINKIAQKVGEEAVELVIEAKDDNAELFLGEAADLMYHYLVLLAAKNFTLNDVINILKQRHK